MGTMYFNTPVTKDGPSLAVGRTKMINAMNPAKFADRDQFIKAQLDRLKIEAGMPIDRVISSITIDLDKTSVNLEEYPLNALGRECKEYNFERMDILENLIGFPISDVENIPINDVIQKFSVNHAHKLTTLEGIPSNMPALKTIDISDAYIETLEHFPFAPKLETLRLDDAPKLKTIEHLTALPNLKTILIKNSWIKDLNGLQRVNSSTKINLTGNRFLRNFYGAKPEHFCAIMEEYNSFEGFSKYSHSLHDACKSDYDSKQSCEENLKKPACRAAWNHLKRRSQNEIEVLSSNTVIDEDLANSALYLYNDLICEDDREVFQKALQGIQSQMAYVGAERRGKLSTLDTMLRNRWKVQCKTSIGDV